MPFHVNSIDTITPANAVFSAKFRRSFAYRTVQHRLPVTITRVIDHLVRDKDHIVNTFGEYTKEELKEVIGSFSKLKNELQTNKPFTVLTSDGPDVTSWNTYYERETEREGEEPRWFSTSLLYVECYMYRRIHEAFELRPYYLNDFQFWLVLSFLGHPVAAATHVRSRSSVLSHM